MAEAFLVQRKKGGIGFPFCFQSSPLLGRSGKENKTKNRTAMKKRKTLTKGKEYSRRPRKRQSQRRGRCGQGIEQFSEIGKFYLIDLLAETFNLKSPAVDTDARAVTIVVISLTLSPTFHLQPRFPSQ